MAKKKATAKKSKKKQNISKECREVLSREMKAGNRKGAMKKFWECRRAHEKAAKAD